MLGFCASSDWSSGDDLTGETTGGGARSREATSFRAESRPVVFSTGRRPRSRRTTPGSPAQRSNKTRRPPCSGPRTTRHWSPASACPLTVDTPRSRWPAGSVQTRAVVGDPAAHDGRQHLDGGETLRSDGGEVGRQHCEAREPAGLERAEIRLPEGRPGGVQRVAEEVIQRAESRPAPRSAVDDELLA